MGTWLTVEQFRAMTGRKDGDDAVVESAIAAASELAQAELGRTLAAGEHEQRHFHWGTAVLLDAYPVRQVHAVRIDGVEVSCWQLDDAAGIIRFPRPVCGQVEVSYEGGMEEVPTAILQATAMMALSIMNAVENDGQALMSERLGDYMMMYYNGSSGTNGGSAAQGAGALSMAAKALLAPYKDRRVIG